MVPRLHGTVRHDTRHSITPRTEVEVAREERIGGYGDAVVVDAKGVAGDGPGVRDERERLQPRGRWVHQSQTHMHMHMHMHTHGQ